MEIQAINQILDRRKFNYKNLIIEETIISLLVHSTEELLTNQTLLKNQRILILRKKSNQLNFLQDINLMETLLTNQILSKNQLIITEVLNQNKDQGKLVLMICKQLINKHLLKNNFHADVQFLIFLNTVNLRLLIPILGMMLLKIVGSKKVDYNILYISVLIHNI